MLSPGEGEAHEKRTGSRMVPIIVESLINTGSRTPGIAESRISAESSPMIAESQIIAKFQIIEEESRITAQSQIIAESQIIPQTIASP
jgi:hypothetical protein